MTTLEQTAFAKLEAEKRLQNPVLKAATPTKGRFGFRGEIAIKFAEQLADEGKTTRSDCRPSVAIATEGEKCIPFLACYLLSFGYLNMLAESLGDTLQADGKYFVFCNNIDLLKKYQVSLGGATFYIYPLDESTVYNEMLELLRLEKGDLKKLDTATKLDVIADKALNLALTTL